MPSKKLSPTMEMALQAIADQGGEALPIGGGSWKGADGEPLKVEPVAPSLVDTVGTRTIYALEDRGMLQRKFTGTPSYRDTRTITAAGRAALAAEQLELDGPALRVHALQKRFGQ